MADARSGAIEVPKVSPGRALKKLARHVLHHTEDVVAEAFLLSYVDYIPSEGPDLFSLWKEFLQLTTQKGGSVEKRDRLVNFMKLWTKHYPSDLNSTQYTALLGAVKAFDNNGANELKLLLFQATSARLKQVPPRAVTANPYASPLRGASPTQQIATKAGAAGELADSTGHSPRALFSQSMTKKVTTLSRRERPIGRKESDGGEGKSSENSNENGKVKKKKKGNLAHQFSSGELPIPGLRIISKKPRDVAEALCQIEAEIFRTVQPREFIGQRWQKEDKEKNSPNLLRFINRFNDVSFWVATEVLMAKDKERQAKLICKFIKIAKILWKKYTNFNGLMAVLSGLGIHPIQRLTETWELVPAKKQELRNKMAKIMSSLSNFKKYRDALSSTQPDVPRIPYLAVILKDLTLINEGNMKYKESGYINWERIEMIYEQVEAIKIMQNSCRYKQRKKEKSNDAVSDLKEGLSELKPVTDEKALYNLSYRFQPKPAGVFDESDEIDTQQKSNEGEESDGRPRGLSAGGMALAKSLQSEAVDSLNSPGRTESLISRSANHAEMLKEIVRKSQEKRSKGEENDSDDDSDESGEGGGKKKDKKGEDDSDDDDALPPLKLLKPGASGSVSNPNSPRVKTPKSPKQYGTLQMKLTTVSHNEFPLDASDGSIMIKRRKKKGGKEKKKEKDKEKEKEKKDKEKRRSSEDIKVEDTFHGIDSTPYLPTRARSRSQSNPEPPDELGHESEKEKEKEKGKEKEGEKRKSRSFDAESGESSTEYVNEATVMKISSFYEGKRRTYYVPKAVDFNQFMLVLGKKHSIDPSEVRFYSFTYESKDGSGKQIVSDEEAFAIFLVEGVVGRGKHSTHIWVESGVY